MTRKNGKAPHPHTLVGRYFHSTEREPDGFLTIHWQGRIDAEVSPGIFLVQLFEWVLGSDSDEFLMTIPEMKEHGFLFYDNADEMQNYYQEYSFKLRARACLQPETGTEQVLS